MLDVFTMTYVSLWKRDEASFGDICPSPNINHISSNYNTNKGFIREDNYAATDIVQYHEYYPEQQNKIISAINR
jgi:hypothetical protein